MSDSVLTFAAQKALVLERRFPSSAPAGQWLAVAYADVWNAAAWGFKRVSGETFYTTVDGTPTGQASASPLMPSSFARPLAVYDDQGDELTQMAAHQFETVYTPDSGAGRPEAFTVVGRQILLAPAPDSSYQFQLSYRRRLATRTAAGATQPGFYQADTDLPLWDDHHYILVVRAKMVGLHDRSDGWSAIDSQQEYELLLASMQEDYEERPRGWQTPRWP